MEDMCAEGACCAGKELLVRQHCSRFDMIDRRARQEACGHTKATAGVQKENLTILSPRGSSFPPCSISSALLVPFDCLIECVNAVRTLYCVTRSFINLISSSDSVTRPLRTLTRYFESLHLHLVNRVVVLDAPSIHFYVSAIIDNIQRKSLCFSVNDPLNSHQLSRRLDTSQKQRLTDWSFARIAIHATESTP